MSNISKVKRKKYVTGNKHLNSGGKYLYKEGIKKHFKDYEINQALLDGWLTYEKYRENIRV